MKPWRVTYQDKATGERHALTWDLTETEAMQQAEIAASLGLLNPRAERADVPLTRGDFPDNWTSGPNDPI